MSLPSVAEILDDHVTLELESIDRMYLNVYVPELQCEQGVVGFFRGHKGYPFVSSALMDPISKSFIGAMERYVTDHKIPVVSFKKGERKDDVTAEYLAKFEAEEGVLFLGKAQEKASVFRTEKRRNPQTGAPYPWLVRTTAMVNQYYWYCVDRDFGPFFLKFCSYFPYTAKVCLNGHEWLKRQLAKSGIDYDALDNGVAECDDPEKMQKIADRFSAAKVGALVGKWMKLLPNPYTPADWDAGFTYDISILQAEFALTQVFDRPVTGRVFFEEVIRENLDIGRPDQVQLIFDRKVTRKTPGRFRTRVITEGVIPSLHVDYKRSRIKQYHKEGRALRTETTINDTRDFGIGKRLHNLPELREIGFEANRRLLDVQRISHDCAIGEDALTQVTEPRTTDRGERVSGLRFAEVRVQALFQALVMFRLLPTGFSNRDLRAHLAPLLGLDPATMTQGRMTYDLRRLRLHGLIERIPKTHRYRVTDMGLRSALFLTRAYARILRPGLALVMPDDVQSSHQIRIQFQKLERVMDQWVADEKLAA